MCEVTHMEGHSRNVKSKTCHKLLREAVQVKRNSMAFCGMKEEVCFQLVIYLLAYKAVSYTVSLRLLKPGTFRSISLDFVVSFF